MRTQTVTALRFAFNTSLIVLVLTITLGMVFTMATGLRWFTDFLMELSGTSPLLRIITSSVIYLSFLCVGVAATAATVLGIRGLHHDTFKKGNHRDAANIPQPGREHPTPTA